MLYKTTGIPVEIRWFFTLEQLSPGKKENVTLLYEGNHYDAFFSMGVQESPRSRLVWRSDFSSIIQSRFQNLYRSWKHDNEDPEGSGYIVFKRKSAILYEVFFDTIINDK